MGRKGGGDGGGARKGSGGRGAGGEEGGVGGGGVLILPRCHAWPVLRGRGRCNRRGEGREGVIARRS